MDKENKIALCIAVSLLLIELFAFGNIILGYYEKDKVSYKNYEIEYEIFNRELKEYNISYVYFVNNKEIEYKWYVLNGVWYNETEYEMYTKEKIHFREWRSSILEYIRDYVR